MSQILRRLERLERETNVAGRLMVIFSNGSSDQEIKDMLKAEHGITATLRDRVLHFVTYYEDEDGNVLPPQGPPTYRPIPSKGFFKGTLE